MAFSTEILDRLRCCGVVAGFSVDDVRHAVPIAEALLAGGIDAIELTLRTDAGIASVKSICDNVPDMLVGVGTILTPEAAGQVHEAGAAFGVAPGLSRRVVVEARKVGLQFAPGIATPSDVEAAIELNCDFVKFFPAEASGGIKYLRSMSAPYQHLGIAYFPLGGINADNMLDYLREPNVPTVGGSWIVKKDLVQSEDWAGLQARAADVAKALQVELAT